MYNNNNNNNNNNKQTKNKSRKQHHLLGKGYYSNSVPTVDMSASAINTRNYWHIHLATHSTKLA